MLLNHLACMTLFLILFFNFGKYVNDPASEGATDIGAETSPKALTDCIKVKIELSYMVTFFNDGLDSNYSCVGILVSARWVLTSHCCTLKDNATVVIGVDMLHGNVSDRNLYKVNKKIISYEKNTELIQMDREVQWNFVAPQISAVDKEEMSQLLQNEKCSVVAWSSIDDTNRLFELKQYPLITSENDFDVSKNKFNVIVLEYELCGFNIGCPVVCDGFLAAIVLETGENCRKHFEIEMVCPILEWIAYYTGETAYFEETSEVNIPRNLSLVCLSRILDSILLILILVLIN